MTRFVALLLLSFCWACKSSAPVESEPDFEKALKYHNRSLRLDPEYGPTYRARGNVYYEAGQFEEALKDYNKALSLKDSAFQTFYQRGLTYLQMGRMQEAEADLEHAWEQDPSHAQTLSYLSFFKLEEGAYSEAEFLANDAIKTDSILLTAYLNRGSARYHLEKYTEAISDFQFVLAMQEQHAIAHTNLGLALCGAGLCEEGQEHLNKAIEINPNLPEAWYNRGLTSMKNKAFGDAVADFSAAINLDAQKAHYFKSRGLSYYKLAELDKARADFRKARMINPNLKIMIDGKEYDDKP